MGLEFLVKASIVGKETMATGDKSSSPHTHLNHVELGTNPTGEGKNSEFTFSNGPEGTKEDGSVMTNTTTGTTHATLSQTTTPPVHPPASEATTSSPDLQTNTTSENKVIHVSNQPSASTPAPRPTTRPPVMEVEMQRSKEGDSEVVTTPAHPKVSGGSSRIRAASIDEASHLMELLSSPEGDSQIVERSPGERYVRFSEKLGSGASKDVYRAYDTEEGIEVAWNVVHLAGVPKTERNRIVNEVRLLERLHHQNIISFHGSWINREQQQVNFVTEILSSGTLKSFINKVQVIRWKIAKRWARQILKGLEYLHSQDPPVIHRDLKCENIFINGTSGDLRIGDLGLSTVHRNNGKALSVLGTPEFMAPDMYEEGLYDEKVDIYAFGMCLLEIFTKEIPYKECTNPAQIYKKVTRGAPPNSLNRLKSDHARQFIELCLGYRNDDGKYVRPSAKELLDHPFLEKRPVDDEEVEVDPPLQEQAIKESGTRSAERLSSESRGTNATTSNSASTTHSQNVGSPSKEVPPAVRHNLHQNSLYEDESDRFEEMPDSEVNNMKKVKVMMGRGEELKEDDDIVEDVNHVTNRNSLDVNTSIEVASLSSAQNAQQNNDTNGNYLVAAAVIQENKQINTDQMPYPDDILKLVITLPVEGQTQNVQFDFDLVEDDPIQVAKEMVAELGIPEDAVLEISETVSGLARDARTKKHKFNSAKAQQNPGHIRKLITSRPNATSESQVGQTAVAQPQTQQHLVQGIMQPTNQQPPMQQPMSQQGLPHGQPLMDNNQMTSQMQHMQQQRGSIQSGDPEPHRQAQIPYVQAGIEMSAQMEAPKQSQMNGEYHHQGHVSSETKQPLAPYNQAPVPPPAPSMSMPGSGSQIPQQRPPQPSHGAQQPSPLVAPPGDSSQQTIATSLPSMPNQQIHGSSQSLSQAYSPHQQLQPTMQRAHSFTQPQQQQPQLVQPPVQQIPNIPPQQHMPNVVQQQPPIQLQMNRASSLPPQQQQLQQAVTTQQHQIHQGRTQQIQQPPMAQQRPNQQQEYQVAPTQVPPHGQRIATGSNSMSLPMTKDIPVAQHNGPHLRINEGIVSSATDPSQATTSRSRTPSLEKEQEDDRPGESMGALEGLSIDTSGEDEPTDEACAEELRKLDEDFHNNLKRAKKVFVNRMDNLQRTQVQREAQHQKTLEQHQKDRTAFEKRLQQEEIEQNRRIELLQAEWDRRREEVRSKDKSPNPNPSQSHGNSA